MWWWWGVPLIIAVVIGCIAGIIRRQYLRVHCMSVCLFLMYIQRRVIMTTTTTSMITSIFYGSVSDIRVGVPYAQMNTTVVATTQPAQPAYGYTMPYMQQPGYTQPVYGQQPPNYYVRSL